MISISIDGKKYSTEAGKTILEVAQANHLDIPFLCYHPDQTVKANCRMCVVEIKGMRGLQTACSVVAVDGMEIISDTHAVREARKFNLELIFGEHKLECEDCVYRFNCNLLRYGRQYNAKINRFPCRKGNRPIYQFGPIVFDQTKCIDCRDCVEACPVNYLEVDGRGSDIGIKPSAEKWVGVSKDCIYCGQCLVHCPVGAIETAGEFEYVNRPFEDKNKIVVVEIAPSVRSSIGEMFDMPHGTIVMEKLAAALRQVGCHKVFDTSVSADFTTMEEAKELVERLESGKNLPMFTGCCPSWVRYLEFYHPEFIPNITTVRSPQIIMGGLIKTYWAQKEKIDPKNIVVVSIMPCTSKKFECERKELRVNGMKPVDYVLTTRELGYLLKTKNIDLAKIEPDKLDNPFGAPSGAGVIYGASGGVMEAALRTAYYLLSGRDLDKIDITDVRGLDGLKKAEATLETKTGEKKTLKVAVMNGMKNIGKVLAALKADPHAFDYIEIMACPGGCIGGGGQPLPVSDEIRRARALPLYQIDKSGHIRTAHSNPYVQQVYREYFTDEKKIHPICHTKYKRATKTKIRLLKDSKHTFTTNY